MNATQRATLQEQLRAMAAGRGEGIDLDTQERWAIENVCDPRAFFCHLQLLIPSDGILYIEGVDMAPEAAKFYEANRATQGTVCVIRDTVYPVPEIFHVQMGQGIIEGLVKLLEKHPLPNCLTHVKGYREGRLVFAFHDAFESSVLLVSGQIAEENIQSFCEKLGATYRPESNVNKRDPEVFQRLLDAMENPQKVRIFWPWWKKALFFWKK